MPINIVQQPTNGVYFPQPQQDGATMVNQATQEAATTKKQEMEQAALQQYIQQQAAQQQVAQGLLGNTPATYGNLAAYRETRPYLDTIAKAKGQYDIGNAMRDERGNVTPEGQVLMTQAHNTANQARAMLAAMGADYGDYDNVPSAQAAQNLAMRDNQFLNNVMGMDKSSGDVFQEEYIKNMRTGMSERRAMENADLVARNYSNRRAGLLNDAFQMYGQSDNAINPLGLQLLNRLAQEDQEAANAYYKTFGNPRDEYTLGNQLAVADAGQKNMLERMNLTQAFNRENVAAAQQFQREMARLNYEIAEAHKNNDIGRQVVAMQAKAALMEQYGLDPRLAFVSGGKSSTASNSTKFESAYAKELREGMTSIIEAYGGDIQAAQQDPRYQQYQQMYDAVMLGQQKNLEQAGINLDPNNYNSAMAFMTQGVKRFANGGSDKVTKADMEAWWESLGIPREWIDHVEWGETPKEETPQQEEKPKTQPPTKASNPNNTIHNPYYNNGGNGYQGKQPQRYYPTSNSSSEYEDVEDKNGNPVRLRHGKPVAIKRNGEWVRLNGYEYVPKE